jgi:hypothetical protein
MQRLFWGFDEAVVVAYLFVVMFGAVRPGEILPVTLAVGVLAGLWVWHASLSAH